MKIYLDTVGCRLNQSEIEIMARQFRTAGHEVTPDVSVADLVVINTCTVTSQAASDSRQKVRQAARSGAEEIILTGCWSTMEPDLAKNLPHVRAVIPNDRKEKAVSEILGTSSFNFALEPKSRKPLPGSRHKTRAFIKVQDGCDNHCTFCVTRLARGKAVSRNITDILNDIRLAVLGGTKEIVLTGVHLGSWGQDANMENKRLKGLVQTILKETDIPRLRLSSLEPWDLHEDFFCLWEDQRLCRHLHLPLQSGSPTVLKRMARKTTPQNYADLLKKAREVIPDVAITTDLIVGFPGETDQEFQDTFDFIQKMSFSGGHVFKYSPRPGTVAAHMTGQVVPDIKKNRNARLRDLLLRSKLSFSERFIGTNIGVLWESSTLLGNGSWKLEGLTDNYLSVKTHAFENRWNVIDQVQLKSLEEDGIEGDVLYNY